MFVPYRAEEGLFVRRLMAAIAKWAAANDADERQFAEEVIRRIEKHAKLAEIRKQIDIRR